MDCLVNKCSTMLSTNPMRGMQGTADGETHHSSFNVRAAAAKALHSGPAPEKLTLTHLLASTVEVSMPDRLVVPAPPGSGSSLSALRQPLSARWVGARSPSGSGSHSRRPDGGGAPSAYSMCTFGPLGAPSEAPVGQRAPGLPRPRSGLLACIQDVGEPSQSQ